MKTMVPSGPINSQIICAYRKEKLNKIWHLKINK